MKKLFLIPVIFLSLTFSAFSFKWNFSTPEEHGIDSKVIQKVYDGLKDKDVRIFIEIKSNKRDIIKYTKELIDFGIDYIHLNGENSADKFYLNQLRENEE